MASPIIFATTGTKGGVGKTTLTANLSAVLADIGFRVLMIDADVQPSLSKYFPLHHVASNGIVELLLGDTSEETIASTISQTIYPNLDIVVSNNISADIETKVQNRPDRAFLLKNKLHLRLFKNDYDVIIMDTQGAVGVLQETASFAAECLLTPVMPEVLSAREFVTGTQEALSRLQHGENMGLTMPMLRAIIYAQDRTKDARLIADEIRSFFNKNIDGKRQLLQTIIPNAKAYKEAATLRIPVHFHERTSRSKTDAAYTVMHNLVYELLPVIKERNLKGNCFDDMKALLPEAGSEK